MTWNNLFRTARRNLLANRSRSLLTLLGIVIGITAIILVMSVGRGAEELILNQIRGLGSRTIIVEPGREPKGPASFVELFTDSLKIRDLPSLKNPAKVPGLSGIAPNVVQVVTVAAGAESLRTSVIGSAELLVDILGVYPAVGNFFTAEDIKQKAAVAVIGVETGRKLFGQTSPLGQKLRIKDRTFRIVGIFPAKGQVALFNIDDLIVVPYSTAQEYLFGINYFHSFIIQAASEALVPRTVSDLKLTLRENHGITDPAKDDFHITTQADAAERVGMITGILTALLVSVAAISLLVGGIGIMNIMLVSVTERTREIGLRKALGATNRDILYQFLLEAILLTALGGISGIILGAILALAAALILNQIISLGWQFTFPLSAAILGLLVSSLVGLTFGIYPARRAAQKNPIEALRYE